MFAEDTKLVITSTEMEFGAAKDRYFIGKKEVPSSELGGLYACYNGEIKIYGCQTLIKFRQMYVGDIKKISLFRDPNEILKTLLQDKLCK